MPLRKKSLVVLMGAFALGISWQTMMTVSADELTANSANVAAVTDSQSQTQVQAATAGTTVSTDEAVTPAAPPAQAESQTSPATADSSTYDSSNYGANLPYTGYEAEQGTLANGAKEEASTDVDSTAGEASDQKYVELPNQGSSVSVQVEAPANAINVRYTIPDGTSGQLDVQVNGNSVANLDLSSSSAWQYLDTDVENDSPTANSRARFRFDEVHSLLKDIQLKKGDTLTLVKNSADNVAYGIDFIELEQAGDPIAQADNAISITSKGAVANDGQDDSQALFAAINEAKSTGRHVYIPAGQFDFNQKIGVDASNLKISGAGIWHTHLHFTSDQAGGGGFEFNHNDNGIELSDFFMDSNLTSRYHEAANYKAISGTLGSNSSIHDIWEQHFECGMWIGDYDAANMHYTDGLVVKNARIRNNLADGINFAQGTKNSTVENSNIRGNGDDGLATWSSIDGATNATIAENNKFLHNTIELGWRAGGIGIFGGKGHEVANNLIKNNIAGAGIRLSTVFAGHNFDTNDTGINIHDNLLWKTGTTSDLYRQPRSAIDLQTQRGDIKNVVITDNKILNSVTKAYSATDGQGTENVRFVNNSVDDQAHLESPKPVEPSVTPAPTENDQPSQPSAQAPADQPAPMAEAQPQAEEVPKPEEQLEADTLNQPTDQPNDEPVQPDANQPSDQPKDPEVSEQDPAQPATPAPSEPLANQEAPAPAADEPVVPDNSQPEADVKPDADKEPANPDQPDGNQPQTEEVPKPEDQPEADTPNQPMGQPNDKPVQPDENDPSDQPKDPEVSEQEPDKPATPAPSEPLANQEGPAADEPAVPDNSQPEADVKPDADKDPANPGQPEGNQPQPQPNPEGDQSDQPQLEPNNPDSQDQSNGDQPNPEGNNQSDEADAGQNGSDTPTDQNENGGEQPLPAPAPENPETGLTELVPSEPVPVPDAPDSVSPAPQADADQPPLVKQADEVAKAAKEADADNQKMPVMPKNSMTPGEVGQPISPQIPGAKNTVPTSSKKKSSSDNKTHSVKSEKVQKPKSGHKTIGIVLVLGIAFVGATGLLAKRGKHH
ncbi:right-handed parallel beta-helix repeat-containing protein [Streptococcus tangpeifui]|uniref:right-handed parallel beta-helix repeat-containing protein n=1 Tax=Streptococcus tangpeifui TaxID=2709400 RepID=UPI0013EB17F5|nr:MULTISPECIES: right-handed parallel beta-helix repeat-containing protein [unclassified Streptococcus]